jgi:hypothetical protein
MGQATACVFAAPTQRYTDVDAAQLVRGFEQAHPRAKVAPKPAEVRG